MTIKTHIFEILPKAIQHETHSICVPYLFIYFWQFSRYFCIIRRMTKTALCYQTMSPFPPGQKARLYFPDIFVFRITISQCYIGKNDGPLAHNNSFHAHLHTVSLSSKPGSWTLLGLPPFSFSPHHTLFPHSLFYVETFIQNSVTYVIYFRSFIIQCCVRQCHSIPELNINW